MGVRRVQVELEERSYPILIGGGALSELPGLIGPKVSKVAVVTQASIPLSLDIRQPFKVVTVPDGEVAKSFVTLERVISEFVEFGLSRADLVIGFGGGVVTDLAGFAASIYHRGVTLVNVPTTLLGMVDAAIGGKTAINIREGKNLVGSFHQPRAVICDTSLLETLPPAEILCGRGEMAKYAFLGADNLLQLSLDAQVEVCAAIKAQFVSSDETEGGRRALLNYGHTLAHALEAQGDLVGGEQRIKHGQAVAIGLIFAARLALSLGRIDESRLDEHLIVVRSFGLDSKLPDWADPGLLIELMRRDKKAIDGLTFVLDGQGGLEVVQCIDPGLVRSELELMSRDKCS